jgi:hypothetical protein
MRAALLCALFGILPLSGQDPFYPFWKPDPKRWRLEVLTPLGGWSSAGPSEIQLRLVDSSDPRPPRDPALEYWEAWQREREARTRALRLRTQELLADTPEAQWQPEAGEEQMEEEEGLEASTTSNLSILLLRLRAERQAEEELDRAEDMRRPSLKVWCNGEAMDWRLSLNRLESFSITPVQGENRIELLEPVTGQRLVRTWWCEGRNPRLRVVARELDTRWSSWNLEVLEPGGKRAAGLQDFEKSHPASGTYTLRWDAGEPSEWWSPEDARPRIVQVDVILDGGKDRERRWRFEPLVLPGTGPVVIGSFDVED